MTDEVQNPLPPGDVPNGASPVAFSVDGSTPDSVKDVLKSVSESPTAASSPAEPKTFEQRVEERFLQLEHALMGLPHSIHTVLSQGSTDAESFGKAVLAHLFGKQ